MHTFGLFKNFSRKFLLNSTVNCYYASNSTVNCYYASVFKRAKLSRDGNCLYFYSEDFIVEKIGIFIFRISVILYFVLEILSVFTFRYFLCGKNVTDEAINYVFILIDLSVCKFGL